MAPVTTGSLIERSFAVFRAGFVPFSAIALLFYAPIAFLQLTVSRSQDSEIANSIEASQGLLLMLAYVLVIPVASAAVVYGVFQGLRGRPATLGQCISAAAVRGPSILGLAVLTVLVVGTGYLLCIVPGVVLTYGLFIAGPILIVEKLEPIDAMKRSWELTDGYKTVLFFLALAIGILQLAVGIPINLAFGAGALGTEPVTDSPNVYQILQSLVVAVFIAFNATAAGVAYHDLRSFREGLDEDQLVAVFD